MIRRAVALACGRPLTCVSACALPLPYDQRGILSKNGGTCMVTSLEDNKMKTVSWLKPGVYGAAIGAVALAVLGFSWGGWQTAGGAATRAQTASHDSVIAAMVPVCLDLAQSDPERSAKMETIRAASTYKQKDAVMSAGWATVPGAEKPDADIAKACLSALAL